MVKGNSQHTYMETVGSMKTTSAFVNFCNATRNNTIFFIIKYFFALFPPRAPGCSPAAEERMQRRAGEVTGQCKKRCKNWWTGKYMEI